MKYEIYKLLMVVYTLKWFSQGALTEGVECMAVRGIVVVYLGDNSASAAKDSLPGSVESLCYSLAPGK